MHRMMRIFTTFGLLAVAWPQPSLAQGAAPKDATGQTAAPGKAVTTSQAALDAGGKRPPTDVTGQTAPAGTPLAPSRLASPNGTPAPASTTKQ